MKKKKANFLVGIREKGGGSEAKINITKCRKVAFIWF